MNQPKRTLAMLSLALLILVPAYTAQALPSQKIAAPKETVNQLSPLTADDARVIAEKLVPANSSHYQTERSYTIYQVKFYNETAKENYEVKVNRDTHKVVGFESERYGVQTNSTKATLSEEAIKKAVKADLAGVEVSSLTLEQSDNILVYEVRVKAASYYGEVTVHAKTGQILERDLKMGTLPAAQDTSKFLSQEQITKLAKEQVPDAVLTDIDLEKRGNTYYFDVELQAKNIEYHLSFDATTGALLNKTSHQDLWDDDDDDDHYTPPNTNPPANTPPATNQYISVDRAKEIALAKVPGATVIKCKLDKDDGRAVYEGELRKGAWEYEFEIDAVTGKIIEWDSDYDD